MAKEPTWRLLGEAGGAWLDDRASSMGAALAFYTLFSIAPLLLIVISLAGLVFGEQAARGEILGEISGLVGQESAKTIESLLQSLNRPHAGILGSLIGIGVLLVGATSVFAELQGAMDRIWRAPASAIKTGIWGFLRTRLLSLGMVLGIGFMLIASLIVSAGLTAISNWWAPRLGGVVYVAALLNFSLSFIFLCPMFAMIYKWMPRVDVAWRDVWIGASITALLFTIGKSAIGVYLGSSGVASAFGAAASLIVLLLWVYYSAQIFLLGAEFTRVYAVRLGSLRETGTSIAAPSTEKAPMLMSHSDSPHRPAWFRLPMMAGDDVDVPQPTPDTGPAPPQPAPRPPDAPPEIIEPPVPGQHAPIREPNAPGAVSIARRF